MPVGWHNLQELADVSWFSARTGSVTRLLADFLKSHQAPLCQQVFPLHFNSVGTVAWIMG